MLSHAQTSLSHSKNILNYPNLYIGHAKNRLRHRSKKNYNLSIKPSTK